MGNPYKILFHRNIAKGCSNKAINAKKSIHKVELIIVFILFGII